MQNGLDRLLATYCSPTLAGIKPASLVSCDRNLYPDLPQRLSEYRNAFAAREIHFEIVCACSARFLLLVYNKPQLERRMAEPAGAACAPALCVPGRSAARCSAAQSQAPHRHVQGLSARDRTVPRIPDRGRCGLYSIRRKGLQIKRSLEGVRRCRGGIPTV